MEPEATIDGDFSPAGLEAARGATPRVDTGGGGGGKSLKRRRASTLTASNGRRAAANVYISRSLTPPRTRVAHGAR